MMIIITALFGAVAACFFLYMFAWRWLQKNGTQIRTARRLQSLKDDNSKVKEKEPIKRVTGTLADIPFLERTIKPVIRNAKERLLKSAPTDIAKMLEEKIMLAGKTGVWSINSCVMVWLASSMFCAVLAIALIRNSGFAFIQSMVIGVIGAIIGGVLPFVVLNNMITKRKKEIRQQLPEFLDLLCVSVQAGLSFEGAVSKIASRMKGPLIEEFKHMQRDGQMGIPRKTALQQMSKRCDLEEMYLFTASIIQAERLGTSMANTLTNQADNMRERHRQYVKAQALKAPVKIIFPLIIFILPAIFIVVLLPTLMSLMKNLGG